MNKKTLKDEKKDALKYAFFIVFIVKDVTSSDKLINFG